MSKNKTVVTIEARMGATRLPGKVLLEVCGKPLLQHLVERLKRAQLPDDVVVATTINPKDDAVESLCKKIGCTVFRGSENDITERLIRAAHFVDADVIVQTTGDCPLLDPEIVDLGISIYRQSNVDYVSNRLKRTFPTGQDVQIFSVRVLEKVSQKTQDPSDREHGSYYIYTHPREFTMKNFESTDLHCPEKRWLLDYPEDFLFMKAVYESLYPKKPNFDRYDVLELLKKNPDFETINKKYGVSLQTYEHFEIL